MPALRASFVVLVEALISIDARLASVIISFSFTPILLVVDSGPSACDR